MTKSSALGLIAIVAAGCGGDPIDDGAHGAPGPITEPSFVPKAGIAGTVTSSSATREALPGSDVCLSNAQAMRCTQTSSAGWYELASSAEDRISAFFEKSGHLRARIDAPAPRGPLFADVLMIPDADAVEFAAAAGRKLDPATTGGLVVATNTIGYSGLVPLSDITVTLRGVAGGAVTYANEAGHPDATLRATSSAGWAAAIGLAPARVSIELQPAEPGVVCTTLWDGAEGLGRPIDATIEAGHVTMLLVACVRDELFANGS